MNNQPPHFNQEDNGMETHQEVNNDDNFHDENDKEFDNDFDAGVEANEEEDPKKYIQQLTGKLSQSLRKFNDENEKVDDELNKYVAGMIIKQALKGLSTEDTNEILKKVKEEGNNDEDVADKTDTENENQPQMDDKNDFNENYEHVSEQHIDEIVNGVLDQIKQEKKNTTSSNSDNVSYKKKPFTAPIFKI